MSLKDHNDIVEKLIKQIDAKDKEIQALKKNLNKATSTALSTKSKPQTDKQYNKKIALLQKQYKEKISSLNQQIVSKTNQNNDLKQRINTMKNIQAKQKQQVNQVLKKAAVMAAHDPKFAAFASHYQAQIQKKDKYIASLQKQIKQNYYNLTKKQADKRVNYGEMDYNNQQNDSPVHENIISNKGQNLKNDEHYHTKYQQQIGNLKAQNNKLQRLLQQKSKQFKDITKKYANLTKQYYKILNQYGQQGAAIFNSNQKIESSERIKNTKPLLNKNKKQNILQQMIDNFEDKSEISKSETSLSYSFLSGIQKAQNKIVIQAESDKIQNETETQVLKDLIDNILQILEIQNRIQIIPLLTKLKFKCQQSTTYQNISKFMQSMVYRLGMGKIPISNMIQQLQLIQTKINKLSQSADLLDELCIQVGAKKQKIVQKIRDFKATQEQFFTNMKNIQFMQKLPKANKIVQFIEYFELQKDFSQLPQQLKKMYEQLKCVDRFLKQSNIILNRQPQSLERSLQSILRYMERREAQESLKGAQSQMSKKVKK